MATLISCYLRDRNVGPSRGDVFGGRPRIAEAHWVQRPMDWYWAMSYHSITIYRSRLTKANSENRSLFERFEKSKIYSSMNRTRLPKIASEVICWSSTVIDIRTRTAVRTVVAYGSVLPIESVRFPFTSARMDGFSSWPTAGIPRKKFYRKEAIHRLVKLTSMTYRPTLKRSTQTQRAI